MLETASLFTDGAAEVYVTAVTDADRITAVLLDPDRWRYRYPEFDDTQIRVPIPLEEPLRKKRGRKPKNK